MAAGVRWIYLALLSAALCAALPTVLFRRPEPLPPEKFPAPELAFDRQRAWLNLSMLVTQFPYRVTGRPQDRLAAEWVANRFRELGLSCETESFRRLGAFLPVELKLKRLNGINVAGTSAGRVRDAMVIGAHRDVKWGPGANDNGSGTAVMLELARVLATGPHHYTYIFVSFGAEEAGLLGAMDWVAGHARQRQVRLMLNLDMVGARGASFLGFHGGAPHMPLRLQLAIREAARRHWPPFRSRGEDLTVISRVPGFPGTDSAAFELAAVPAVSPAVIGDPTFPHTPRDSLERLSPESLDLAGRLSEGFLRTVDSARLLGDSGEVVMTPEGYFPGWKLRLARLIPVLFLVLLAVSAILATRPRVRWMRAGVAVLLAFCVWISDPLFGLFLAAPPLLATDISLEETRRRRDFVVLVLTALLGLGALALAALACLFASGLFRPGAVILYFAASVAALSLPSVFFWRAGRSL